MLDLTHKSCRNITWKEANAVEKKMSQYANFPRQGSSGKAAKY